MACGIYTYAYIVCSPRPMIRLRIRFTRIRVGHTADFALSFRPCARVNSSDGERRSVGRELHRVAHAAAVKRRVTDAVMTCRFDVNSDRREGMKKKKKPKKETAAKTKPKKVQTATIYRHDASRLLFPSRPKRFVRLHAARVENTTRPPAVFPHRYLQPRSGPVSFSDRLRCDARDRR